MAHKEKNGVCIYISDGTQWNLIEEAHDDSHKCDANPFNSTDAANYPGAILTVPCVNRTMKKKAKPKKKATARK